MNSWTKSTIGDVSSVVTKGTTPTTGAGGFSNAGVNFIKVESITRNGQIDLQRVAFVSEEVHNKLRRSILEDGDILFSIAGTIGRVAHVTEEHLPANTNQALAIIRPNTEIVNKQFLKYVLLNNRYVNVALSKVVQSVQANLSLSQLSAMEFLLPKMSVQTAIAEVLGALDDKIVANTNVSQTSNDLANALFRRALNNAEFSKDTFADLALVSGGGTPSTRNPDFWDGQVPWATPTDITALTGPYLEETSRAISDAGLKACASDLYPQGTILMTSRATIGSFAIVQKPTAVNQGFIVVQPHDPELKYWIFHEMQSRIDEFISLANGATFLELSRGNFKKFNVRIAPPATMHEFNKQATALHETARMALIENTKLAEIRDTLLPQLLSGKLHVKDAEALVESVV